MAKAAQRSARPGRPAQSDRSGEGSAQGTGRLGLIAGEGAFPVALARAAREAGRRVTCVAFPGYSDPALDDLAEVTWIRPGEVLKGVAAFREAGVREAVMAGKVEKRALFEQPEAVSLDAEARRRLAGLLDRRDDRILSEVADILEQIGIHLLPQWALMPELLVGPGPLTRRTPSPAQAADVAFGLPIAKALGGLDVGQTVVVKDGAVLALEAIEGTDEAIRRGARFADGAVVVKVAKPGQDPRFDVPTIGPRTVAVLAEAKVAVLAFEAGATCVLERERLAADADAAGIAVVGVEGTAP